MSLARTWHVHRNVTPTANNGRIWLVVGPFWSNWLVIQTVDWVLKWKDGLEKVLLFVCLNGMVLLWKRQKV